MTTYDDAKRTMARHEAELIAHANVTHVAVVKHQAEFAIELGLISDENCADVRQLPKLPESLPVPDSSGNISASINSVRVVKRVVGRARRHANTGRHRPALGGDSIGTIQADTGTLGLLWRIKDVSYVISCHHVLYNAMGVDGNDVLQPGPFDGGIPGSDVIAQNSYGEMSERLDIAFARLIGEPGTLADYGTRCFGEVPDYQEAEVGMKVNKCGRTTEGTNGTVRSTDAAIDFGDGQIHRDQILIDMQSGAGDSGSAVLAQGSQNAVGILMGGSELNGTTYANKFTNVLAAGIRNL
ncbi:hypothetical protein FGG78_31645 [Thioclava sp. BHET1]|nr:hypothetical protein FGG78_31645 [Thioclava sp. BHET1]